MSQLNPTDKQFLVDKMEQNEVALYSLNRILQEIEKDEPLNKGFIGLLRWLRCGLRGKHSRRNKYCSNCGNCGKHLFVWEAPFPDD